MNKKKITTLLVAIVCFITLIAGGTYAFMSFGNITIVGGADDLSTCFIIDQDYTNDDGTTTLGGSLYQSSKPRAGLSGKVAMKISDSCAVSGTGSIYLTVNSTTSSSLYKKVSNYCRNQMTNLPMTGTSYDTSSECTNAGYQWISGAHCENPTTLETMTEYTTSSTCSSAGGTWVSANTKSALKYAVYEDITAAPVAVGNINGTGTITLHEGFNLNHEYRSFYVYIWLDGHLADNTYLNMNFDGYIHLGATQTEKNSNYPGEAMAIYSETDNSLRFYRTEDPLSITVGDTYNDLTVTNVYTEFEIQSYDYDKIPWKSVTDKVTKIVFEDYIDPVSTYYWFNSFDNCSYVDVTKLDTSNVKDMESMFNDVGKNATNFTIIGLENWNTSNVINMNFMFGGMAENSIALDIGDLSGWDTSNVTGMSRMFEMAGNKATNFTITGLENWDTSNVTTMFRMFDGTGENSTNNWTLNLSGWNVSNTTMWYNFCNHDAIIEPLWIYGDTYYAVYSADDNSLRYYNDDDVITVGSIYNDLVVTDVLTLYGHRNIMDIHGGFSSYSDVTSIIIEDIISPVVISSWFASFYFSNCSYFDVTKLDTSNVTDMRGTFSIYNSSPTIIGLENWDTSNVVSMDYMFDGMENVSLNLSGWNVCNVKTHMNFAPAFGNIIQPNWGMDCPS